MNKEKNELLTLNQLTFLLAGFLLGPGFFKLPNYVVEKAKQDAWISVSLALSYPLYIILISIYIAKKNPKDNILVLTKKFFGNIIGTIVLIFYFFQWPIATIIMNTDLIRIFRTYAVNFLSPLKISFVSISLAIYAAYEGLKVLGKANEIISYIALPLLAISIIGLTDGSILYLQPVFSSGWNNILKGSIITSYFFTGFEALLLFHPFVYDKKGIKKSVLKAFLICSVVWIWIIFITIYNLGIYVIQKSEWAFILVFESIRIPIVNNFLYIFLFLWSLMSFKTISNHYFSTALVLNEITKIKLNKLYLFLYPISIYLSVIFLDESIKRIVINLISPIYVLFNGLYYTTIALIVYFKGRKSQRTNI